MPNLIEKSSAKHEMFLSGTDELTIHGFGNVEPEDCFIVPAYGERYRDYGIADGSILFCCTSAPVNDGDIVVVLIGEILTVHIYYSDPNMDAGGPQLTLHDKSLIHAKVLGSFNYFH